MSVRLLLAAILFAVPALAQNGGLGSSSMAASAVWLTIEPRLNLPESSMAAGSLHEHSHPYSICANISGSFRLYQYSHGALDAVSEPSKGSHNNCATVVSRSAMTEGSSRFVTLIMIPS